MNTKEKIYKPGEFAKLVGCTVNTLQKWDRDGILKARRTPTGRRFYTESDYEKVTGIQNRTENQVCEVIIYARVSTHGQKKDLKNQVKYLEEFARKKGYSSYKVITDIGSRLNYKRKGFNSILYSDRPAKIIVGTKDRFVRFGYEWFEEFLLKKGSEIIVTNSRKLSSHEEMINDLVSIIHVFSCRIYGLRKYKKALREDEEVGDSGKD